MPGVVPEVLSTCFKMGFIGADPEMLGVMLDMDTACNRKTPLLIEGEEGTERLEAAQCVHQLGGRREGGFHHFHGHFSLFEEDAILEDDCEEGDTLLIDHIEEASPHIQRKLIELIEKALIRLTVTVHSSSDLEQAVEEGFFLKDLYSALSDPKPITIPPLCMRPGDIPLRFYHRLKSLNLMRRRTPHYSYPKQDIEWVSTDALYAAMVHRWPRNVAAFDTEVKKRWRDRRVSTNALDSINWSGEKKADTLQRIFRDSR